jgi:hypothetical protein
MNKYKIAACLGVVVTVFLAWSVLSTPKPSRGISMEAGYVAKIGNAMGDYAVVKGNGQTPATWSQIKEFIDVDGWNASCRELDCSPIEAHYIILTNKFPSLDEWNANVVLIRSTPIINLSGKLGRFYVYWNGEVNGTHFVSEPELQERLKKDGITLPGIDEQEAARAKKLLEDIRIRLGR